MKRRTTKGICSNCKKQATFTLRWQSMTQKEIGAFNPRPGYQKIACCDRCFYDHKGAVEV